MDIAEFLRARYAEARKTEEGKRRVIPSAFDGHEIEMLREGGEEQLLVNGHPYPIEKYTEIATEPAPDQATLEDLDAKLSILETCEAFLHEHEGGPDPCAHSVLLSLARPHHRHPDFNPAWMEN